MIIRNIMIGKNEVLILRRDQSLLDAIAVMDQEKFLVLPVLDGEKIVGFFNKQKAYESFVKSGAKDWNEFASKPVEQFIELDFIAIQDTMYVEEVAELFLQGKMRFLAVENSLGNFVGLVTQKAFATLVTKVFGLSDPKLIIYAHDFVGNLAKIAEIIERHGANITHIAVFDTDIMGVKEISIRLKGENLNRLAEKLQDKGVNVRDLILFEKRHRG